MMKQENINVNGTDANFVLFTFIYNDLIEHWTKEINSNGNSFDFDSQDIYRQAYESIFLGLRLSEKINPENKKEERKVLIEELRTPVLTIIDLYGKNRLFFNSLDREKLRLNEFRKQKFKESNLNDEELNDVLISFIEPEIRKVYFNSELYEKVGFLERNFHEDIYNFSIYLLDLINKKFSSYQEYDKNYVQIYQDNFFNMGLVFSIYKNYNNLFEQISELNFYKVLNLQNTIPLLKIKDQQKTLYLIYKLSTLLGDDIRNKWIHGILDELKITKDIYQKKYKAVVWKNATKDQEDFAKALDTLFKVEIQVSMQ